MTDTVVDYEGIVRPQPRRKRRLQFNWPVAFGILLCGISGALSANFFYHVAKWVIMLAKAAHG